MSKRTQHSVIGLIVLLFAGFVTVTTDRADWFILALFSFGGFMISKSMLVEFFQAMSEYWPFGR